MSQVFIRRLAVEDAKAYRGLRLHALKESPTAYGSDYAATKRRPLSDFEDFLETMPENWNFGAFARQGKLVGTVQLARHVGAKERHKAAIHGLYVVPENRGKGLGRLLLDRALDTAKGWRGLRQINLGVVSTNSAAVALYRSAGFVEYGCEPDALRVGRRFYAETLMVLKLSQGRSVQAADNPPTS